MKKCSMLLCVPLCSSTGLFWQVVGSGPSDFALTGFPTPFNITRISTQKMIADITGKLLQRLSLPPVIILLASWIFLGAAPRRACTDTQARATHTHATDTHTHTSLNTNQCPLHTLPVWVAVTVKRDVLGVFSRRLTGHSIDSFGFCVQRMACLT